MKKKIILRCLIGAPIGLAITTMITIVISLAIGNGNFYPVVPEMATKFGRQIDAVLLQAVFSLLVGAIWGGISIVFEIEHWSLLRQTLTHFLIGYLTTLPIVYQMYWIEHSVSAVLSYFVVFLVVYLFIWGSQYLMIKHEIQKINRQVARNYAADNEQDRQTKKDEDKEQKNL